MIWLKIAHLALNTNHSLWCYLLDFIHVLFYRDSQWGLRDIDDVQQLAGENGLKFLEMVLIYKSVI